MKDFFKIFFVLCGFVGAFLYGRNYGEQTFKQSEEYQKFVKAKDEQDFLRSDIENAKAKLQNILDGSKNKKSEDLLAQILQVFLADLNLKIQNQKLLKENSVTTLTPTVQISEPVIVGKSFSEELDRKPKKAFDYKKLKSYEWILTNAQSSEDVVGNLKNVEIKSMDSYMTSAIGTNPQDEAVIFGSYRGRIMDVLNKEYGTLVLEIGAAAEEGNDQFKGSLKQFRNGKQTSTESFSGTKLGYRFEGSSGIIMNFGSNYYQVYKIPQTQQIAGFYYERLVNGTTKTIGSFVLNRVDQFE